MPRLLASVNWKVTTGGLAIVTLVTAPTGARAAKSVAVMVLASIGVPVGGGTVTFTEVPVDGGTARTQAVASPLYRRHRHRHNPPRRGRAHSPPRS